MQRAGKDPAKIEPLIPVDLIIDHSVQADAAMLGQPTYLPWPVVAGVKLKGQLPVGTTATDLVLTLTELFRKRGVVNKFIQFAGDGLSTLADATRSFLRATLAVDV
jgi:aconitase A